MATAKKAVPVKKTFAKKAATKKKAAPKKGVVKAVITDTDGNVTETTISDSDVISDVISATSATDSVFDYPIAVQGPSYKLNLTPKQIQELYDKVGLSYNSSQALKYEMEAWEKKQKENIQKDLDMPMPVDPVDPCPCGVPECTGDPEPKLKNWQINQINAPIIDPKAFYGKKSVAGKKFTLNKKAMAVDTLVNLEKKDLIGVIHELLGELGKTSIQVKGTSPSFVKKELIVTEQAGMRHIAFRSLIDGTDSEPKNDSFDPTDL